MGWSNWYDFEEKSIESYAPDEPGVYKIRSSTYNFLYPKGKSNIIYYGQSEKGTIKSRLQAHYSGNGDPCVYEYSQQGKHSLEFGYMQVDDPSTTESNLLSNFKDEYGKYPRCNDKG